jgi:tRNA(adenine34) deaminase
MAEALREAALARERGEVPVGAVLLSGHGRVLARSGNAMEAGKDPTAHAEILVLRQAAEVVGNHRLEGCVLAVTLEPCLMCAGAMVHARIAGLVYGCRDSAAGAVESACEALDAGFLNHRVWHMGGICATECSAALRDFFVERR